MKICSNCKELSEQVDVEDRGDFMFYILLFISITCCISAIGLIGLLIKYGNYDLFRLR